MIKADLGLSAEEIETALASNNRNLARIHVVLLKVIYLSVPKCAWALIYLLQIRLFA